MTEQSCTAPTAELSHNANLRTERLCDMTAKEGRVNGTNQERWVNPCDQPKEEQDPTDDQTGLLYQVEC